LHWYKEVAELIPIDARTLWFLDQGLLLPAIALVEEMEMEGKVN